MAKISQSEIDHLGELSRIEIPQNEKEKISRELDEIIDYVEELENASGETNEIKIVSEMENVSREDKITPSLPVEKVLQNAPSKEKNFIKVKKVFN